MTKNFNPRDEKPRRTLIVAWPEDEAKLEEDPRHGPALRKIRHDMTKKVESAVNGEGDIPASGLASWPTLVEDMKELYYLFVSAGLDETQVSHHLQSNMQSLETAARATGRINPLSVEETPDARIHAIEPLPRHNIRFSLN